MRNVLSMRLRSSWLFLGSMLAVVSAQAAAPFWQLERHEGRDYVSLESVAAFYGLPKPPVLIAPGLAPVVPPPTPPAAGPVATAPAGSPSVTPATSAPAPAPAAATPTPAPVAAAPTTPIDPPAPLAPTTPIDPPAPVTAAVAPSPTPAAAPGATIVPAPVVPAAPASLTATMGQMVRLDNGRFQLALAVNTREAYINGVKQWLSFPTRFEGGRLLISTLDLAKTIEPRLRPEKIEGLTPFTTVVLDAGHGGHDKGAASRLGLEKDYSLDVVLRIKPLLERRGIKVVLTRSTDLFLPLPQRPAIANGIKDSIFVSVHFNSTSTNPLARGFEIYSVAPRGAPATNDAIPRARDLREEPANAVDTLSAALAGSVYHAMLGFVPMEDRGIKHARFAVLRLCRQPSILIECGFVSNSAEAALISTPAWRQSVAEAIATGIEEYKSLAEQKHAPKVLTEYRKSSGMITQ